MVTSCFCSLAPSHLSPRTFTFHRNSFLRSRNRNRSPILFNSRALDGAAASRRAPISNCVQQSAPRSLFPGGYRRPEIKLPNVVLRLSSEDVFKDGKGVADVIDEAVSDRVGFVLLTGGEGSGKKMYEAACLLKSVIKDRAFLLIDERVDIAAAVNASGVLLSDQGLPTIIARNTMMDAKSDSVILPLVARNVESRDAALSASDSEGADFLIYTITRDTRPEELLNFESGRVKVPVFVMFDSLRDGMSLKLLESIRSTIGGIVVSMDELSLLNEGDLKKVLYNENTLTKQVEDGIESLDCVNGAHTENGSPGKEMVAEFIRLEVREKQFIEKERLILLEAIKVIQRAAPLMGDISLLKDAVSQLADPFSLVIVGEFNSGKSSVINALLGQKYLKDGVIPTTNEITFLRYSISEFKELSCDRNPDGVFTCYLPAPILKDMMIVDTPGTNVILQRQQRLTEEFVPRADLILFVLSADRPLTESEVTFLRYTQQWKKKVVFLLNKSDMYRNVDELNEAITFIKENAQKMMNTEDINLYPISAQSTLEAKLSSSSGVETQEQFSKIPCPEANKFSDFEKYLYSFFDVSTDNGIERIKLKLETPIKIAERLLSACQKLVTEDRQQAEKDLVLVNNLLSSVKIHNSRMESKSISWKRQILSLVENAQARAIKLVESTLRLSNVDVMASSVLAGRKSTKLPVTSTLQSEIIEPSVVEAQKLLGEYTTWLQSSNEQEAHIYKDSFEKRWPLVVPPPQSQVEADGLLKTKHDHCVEVLGDFSAAAASKLLDQEIREVFVGTVGGLGAAGLSASLLTSILTTTLEDLLALSLCSAGGLLAVSSFPPQRQKVVEKVKRTGDALARQLEEAMEKDLVNASSSLKEYVAIVGKPYRLSAEDRLSKLVATSDELADMERQLAMLQIEIQNLHIPYSR